MNSRNSILAASALLATAFLSHSIVLLMFEPAMGFREFSDFFDLEKIVPALSSTAWFVGNLMHVVVGFALLLLASGIRSKDATQPLLATAFGLTAAPLFVVIGMSGFVADQLTGLLPNIADRDAALLGLVVGARTTILYAAVALFGGLVLTISARNDLAPRWLRFLGLPVGVAGLGFAFLPTPIPLMLFIWAAAFFACTWRQA